MVTKHERSTPFTLLWAKGASVENLKGPHSVFSEDVGGLDTPGMFEKFETTGATPESADTTIGVGA